MRFSLLFLTLCLFAFSNAHAQPDGLWVVQKVTVGGKTMTPVARWSRFQKNGEVVSGNGWVQHTVGRWSYNPKEASLSISAENGIKDEAGPFKIIALTATKMQWQRLEEGELVIVKLEKADVLPQTPGDQIQGLWLLNPSQQRKEPATSPQPYVLIRPDRRFNFRGFPSDFTYGIWHMDGHKPLLTLVANGKEEQWQVEVQPTTMTWTKQGAEGQQEVLHYTRTDTFPK